MKDIYLFIIWNRVLWCERRIVSDLEKSFDIVFKSYIDWDLDKYDENLESLYGSKIPNTKSKIANIGKGRFMILVVKDRNPRFDLRETYYGMEKVNANVYDKKDLYRSWTGRDFRIHASETEKEARHDLSVLLGPDYETLITQGNKECTLRINTKGIEGFDSVEELKRSLLLFNDNIVLEDKNEIFIYTRCSLDLIRFTRCKAIGQDEYSFVLPIHQDEKEIIIYGEDEGDLPSGFIDRAMQDKKIVNELFALDSEYRRFLLYRDVPSGKLAEFYKKHDLDYNREKRQTLRREIKPGLLDAIKKKIRYCICRIKGIGF